MYVISVVDTDQYATKMSVHNESTQSLIEASNRLESIIDDAVNHGWEVINHSSDWAAWLRETKRPDHLSFLQITTCFPVK